MKRTFLKDPRAEADQIKATGVYSVYRENALTHVLAVTNDTKNSKDVIQFMIDESGDSPVVQRRRSKPDGTWTAWQTIPLS
jgi:hypothetical protein